MKINKILITIGILLLFITLTYARERMRLAILDLEGQNVNEATARMVTDLIRTELLNSGLFRVIERGEMKSILKEQEFQKTGCTDTECAVEMGKLLSARKILLGTVGKLGTKHIINARIVDVEKGEAEFADNAEAASEEDLTIAVKEFAQKIGKRIIEGLKNKLKIESQPSLADIYINSKPGGLTPKELTLEPGTHKIVIKKSGYLIFEKQIYLRGSVTTNISAVLQRSEREPERKPERKPVSPKIIHGGKIGIYGMGLGLYSSFDILNNINNNFPGEIGQKNDDISIHWGWGGELGIRLFFSSLISMELGYGKSSSLAENDSYVESPDGSGLTVDCSYGQEVHLTYFPVNLLYNIKISSPFYLIFGGGLAYYNITYFRYLELQDGQPPAYLEAEGSAIGGNVILRFELFPADNKYLSFSFDFTYRSVLGIINELRDTTHNANVINNENKIYLSESSRSNGENLEIEFNGYRIAVGINIYFN